MIKLIWAMDNNNLIGRDNKIPWHEPKDLEYFKKMTSLQPVIMGLNTYNSLKSYYKKKPFPYGETYVASLESFICYDAIIVDDIVDFLKTRKDDIFVIGGAKIYELALPFADELYITRIQGSYDGDTYFPEFNIEEFELVSSTVDNNLIFEIYKRRVQ